MMGQLLFGRSADWRMAVSAINAVCMGNVHGCDMWCVIVVCMGSVHGCVIIMWCAWEMCMDDDDFVWYESAHLPDLHTRSC